MVSGPLRILLAANWGLGERLLTALIENPNVELQGVITRDSEADPADPWATAVRNRAVSSGLKIWDEATLTPAAFKDLVRAQAPDLLWMHAYMRRLDRATYTAAQFGTVNVHASLLPRYRGPAPHHWVLKNRDPESGLTAHFVNDGLDTGPIIHQERVLLTGRESIQELLNKLKGIVPALVWGTVRNLQDPSFRPIVQDESLATFAPAIKNGE